MTEVFVEQPLAWPGSGKLPSSLDTRGNNKFQSLKFKKLQDQGDLMIVRLDCYLGIRIHVVVNSSEGAVKQFEHMVKGWQKSCEGVVNE